MIFNSIDQIYFSLMSQHVTPFSMIAENPFSILMIKSTCFNQEYLSPLKSRLSRATVAVILKLTGYL